MIRQAMRVLRRLVQGKREPLPLDVAAAGCECPVCIERAYGNYIDLDRPNRSRRREPAPVIGRLRVCEVPQPGPWHRERVDRYLACSVCGKKPFHDTREGAPCHYCGVNFKGLPESRAGRIVVVETRSPPPGQRETEFKRFVECSECGWRPSGEETPVRRSPHGDEIRERSQTDEGSGE